MTFALVFNNVLTLHITLVPSLLGQGTFSSPPPGRGIRNSTAVSEDS